MKALLGIGNALVDVIYTCPAPSSLEQEGIVYGIPNHICADVCGKVRERLREIPCEPIPGGGAANTAAAAALLGMKSTFLGKVGNDLNGALFARGLHNYGVEPHLLKGDLPTGCTMIFPQGNGIPSTFIVSIGAAGEFSKGDVLPEFLKGYDYLHMEGFLLNCGDIAEHVLEMARLQGMTISFDLGSKGAVSRHRERMERIVSSYADILFANVLEAEEFSGKSGMAAATAIAATMKDGGICVVKMGEEGSAVACGKSCHMIEPHPVDVVDTLGAGDAYAAGFIYAHSLGASLEHCGKAGSVIASGAVAVRGPRMDACAWKRVRESLQGIGL